MSKETPHPGNDGAGRLKATRRGARRLPMLIVLAGVLGISGDASGNEPSLLDYIWDGLFPDKTYDDLLELDREERRLENLVGVWASRYNWNNEGWKRSAPVCISIEQGVVEGRWSGGLFTGDISGNEISYEFGSTSCDGTGEFQVLADGRLRGKYYCDDASGEWELTKGDGGSCPDDTGEPSPRQADSWLGKWSGASSYSETDQIFKWWFAVSRSCGEYRIQTHTSGPDKVEILNITATELEFLFHDALGTRIKIALEDGESYTGTVTQPNNTGLPRGRVDGRRLPGVFSSSPEDCVAETPSPAASRIETADPETLERVEETAASDPFADGVVAWRVGNPAWSEGRSEPGFALGAPDYAGSHLDSSIATLGCGGQITLAFEDNELADGPGADLRVFEPGDEEVYRVEISTDGADWRSLGDFAGGATIDIAAVAGPGERFRFVRITDLKVVCKGVRPGADVDAVEALNGAAAGMQKRATGPEIRQIEIIAAGSEEVLSEIAVGESFRVRLTFSEEPEAAVSESVTIRTSSGIEKRIVVRGEGRIVSSEPIEVVPLVEP